jgi:isocitrate dehydrogenase kinase/phosphatase
MNPPREPPAHALAMPQASAAAALLVDAFADYNARFADITRRARG